MRMFVAIHGRKPTVGFNQKPASSNKKIMNAKVALNTGNLSPRDKLVKFKKAITACGMAPALASPAPALTVCTTSHDAADAMLDQIETEEGVLQNLRTQRDQLMGVAMANHATLGSCVQTASAGDPAVITKNGFDVATAPTSAPPVGQIMNLVLTHGEMDGEVDAAWNRDKSSRSYEVQTSPDPMTPTSWAPNQIATKSTCAIPNQTIGSKLWARVRGHGKDSPGLWSDPAAIIVT
jgi:hypothetical protein